jgi:hypothetical protein
MQFARTLGNAHKCQKFTDVVAKQENKTTIANFYMCSSQSLFFCCVGCNLNKQIESLLDLHYNSLGILLVEKQELHWNKFEWMMN